MFYTYRMGTIAKATPLSSPSKADTTQETLVHEMLERIADKWTLLVIEELAQAGSELRFTHLAQRVPGVDWESYPILNFSEVPRVEVEIINRPEERALGAGEAASGPTAAAIANAVAHALGVRSVQTRLPSDIGAAQSCRSPDGRGAECLARSQVHLAHG